MNHKGAVNTRWDEGDVRVLKSKWESLTLNGQHAFVSARALFFSEMREEGRESAEERPPWQVNEGPGREADERGCVSTSAGTTEGPVSCAQHGSAGVRRLSPGGLASSPGHSGDLISSPGQAHRVSLGSGRLPAVPSHAHYRLSVWSLSYGSSDPDSNWWSLMSHLHSPSYWDGLTVAHESAGGVLGAHCYDRLNSHGLRLLRQHTDGWPLPLQRL